MPQTFNEAYFYNATIRKTVAVFGSLFNNIYTGKTLSGKLTNIARVPIAYGPRQHFLSRIKDAENADETDVAIKLPRISFEITSLSYDSSTKLNKNNRITYPVTNSNGETRVVQQSTPYVLGMTLSIMSRDQDTALQILEQILPSFNPEYTLSVTGLEGVNSKTDLPIVLNSVSLQDDYEGDLDTGRRIIIYTLEFSIRIKFIGDSTTLKNIIKSVTINLHDGSRCGDSNMLDRVQVDLGDPINDTPDNFTVITTYGFDT